MVSCAQLASLKRYRHIFKLGDVPGGTKEDLIPGIQRHFAQQVRCKPPSSSADASAQLLACQSTAGAALAPCKLFQGNWHAEV